MYTFIILRITVRVRERERERERTRASSGTDVFSSTLSRDIGSCDTKLFGLRAIYPRNAASIVLGVFDLLGIDQKDPASDKDARAFVSFPH